MKKLLVILVSVIMVVSAVCLPMTLSASHEGDIGTENVYFWQSTRLYQAAHTSWSWCDESPYGAYAIMYFQETPNSSYDVYDTEIVTRDAGGDTAYAPVYSEFHPDSVYLWDHYYSSGSYWCHC